MEGERQRERHKYTVVMCLYCISGDKKASASYGYMLFPHNVLFYRNKKLFLYFKEHDQLLKMFFAYLKMKKNVEYVVTYILLDVRCSLRSWKIKLPKLFLYCRNLNKL